MRAVNPTPAPYSNDAPPQAALLQQLRRLVAATDEHSRGQSRGQSVGQQGVCGHRWAAILAAQLLRTLTWLGMCGGLHPQRSASPPQQQQPPLQSASAPFLLERKIATPPRLANVTEPGPKTATAKAAGAAAEAATGAVARQRAGPGGDFATDDLPASWSQRLPSIERGPLRAVPSVHGPLLPDRWGAVLTTDPADYAAAAAQHLAGEYQSLVVLGAQQVCNPWLKCQLQDSSLKAPPDAPQ